MAEHSQLVDAHLHLQDKRFAGQVEAIIRRAENAGVNMMLCNGTAEEDWDNVLETSSHHTTVTPFIGIHPWQSGRITADWQNRLQDLLTRFHCGVGEIGLDKTCGIPLSIQVDLFTRQLQVAVTYGRPVTIHCVKYWGKCLEILEQLLAPPVPIPVMIHSFSGSFETMERLIHLGCHLSFSARITEPDQLKLQSVFQNTPIENVLLETDAPDQLYRSFIDQDDISTEYNEPSRINILYLFAARLLEIDVDHLIRQIWKNSLPYHSGSFPLTRLK